MSDNKALVFVIGFVCLTIFAVASLAFWNSTTNTKVKVKACSTLEAPQRIDCMYPYRNSK